MTEPKDRAARDAMVRSLVTELVSWGVTIAIVVALSKRDWLARQGQRARRVIRQEWRSAAGEAAVAAFRQAVSEWEHSHDHAVRADRGPAPRDGGLYGGLSPGGAAAHGDAADGG